jgi:alkanesulfonate monooxygenase SsuD/methylene tetrahydromethanopterin reductase-like flavin-dependent oxidoreductase (luciferase family)
VQKLPKDIALALRPEVFPPALEIRLARRIDESYKNVTHLFVPDIPRSFESLEIVTADLTVSQRLHVGPGVIRILEHDIELLDRRISTLQSMFGNRFFLGVGVGSPGPNPAVKIDEMLKRTQALRDRLAKKSGHMKQTKTSEDHSIKLEIFVSALRAHMARLGAEISDGLLLNFCSPNHVKRIVEFLGDRRKKVKLVCYLKVFFGRTNEEAERLLAEEFVKYDKLPQYHRMFQEDRVAQDIHLLERNLALGETSVPTSLKRISMANPSHDELAEYVENFRKAGVDLPCIYPYTNSSEDESFKEQIVEEAVQEI